MGDLRTADNEALASASKRHSSLVPVFVFDSRDFPSPASAGRTRATWLIDAVSELRSKLRSMGSDLIVRQGKTEEVLAALAKKAGSDTVYCASQATATETKFLDGVRRTLQDKIALKTVDTNTLHHHDDVCGNGAQLPTSARAYRDKTQGVRVRVEAEVPKRLKGLPLANGLEAGRIPALSDLGFKASSPEAARDPYASIKVGEQAAHQQLNAFVKSLTDGAFTPSPTRVVPAGAFQAALTNLIHPYVSMGSLSARAVYRAVQGQQQRVGAQVVARVYEALVDRDYHTFLTLQEGNRGVAAKAPNAARSLAHA